MSIPRWFSATSALLAFGFASFSASPAAAVTFPGPTSSQPLALDAAGELLAVANPDNDTVCFFNVKEDKNKRIKRLAVQDEPWGVAMLPDGSKTYVANTASGTVSVIMRTGRGKLNKPGLHIVVGAEPYGLALTPNGTRLYVSNARSNSLSVIDTSIDAVIATIPAVGVEPRGLAITNDGDADDGDERVYVTQFLARRRPGESEGSDDARAGHLTVVSTATNSVTGDVEIQPIADTGFLASGDALARVPPGMSFSFLTGAFPNQLNGIALRNRFAYVPSTGASPNGPVRFNVNTQSLLSSVDTALNIDANLTINLHLAVQNQTNPVKRFVTVPWAIAFEHGADEGYVVSAASDILVKIAVNGSTGSAAVQDDPADSTRVLEIATGKNPRGIVVNAADTRAYVMNYVSRDVTVIDLTTSPEDVLATMRSERVPRGKKLAAMVQVGKELFHSSVGVFDPPKRGEPPIVGRLSANGWGSCSSCHPFGLSDDVVWIFPSGPRRTIPLHADFDPTDPDRERQRALNWSAIFDEEADFELNIRNVSGGLGLIVLDDGITPDPDVFAFTPLASTGRNQLKVRRVKAWDALEAFVQHGIRAPISPAAKTDPNVIAGNALFRAANCQVCHGGPLWSSSLVRYTPPPAPGLIVNGQLIGELRMVGTFDPSAFNEVRADAAPALGAAGFAPPSLLSVFAFPGAMFHNGSATSLADVLQNVTHRSAGTGGVDTLTNAADRAKVAQFIESIDAATPPIP
jgi:YVTN family beta-propeller protein